MEFDLQELTRTHVIFLPFYTYIGSAVNTLRRVPLTFSTSFADWSELSRIQFIFPLVPSSQNFVLQVGDLIG